MKRFCKSGCCVGKNAGNLTQHGSKHCRWPWLQQSMPEPFNHTTQHRQGVHLDYVPSSKSAKSRIPLHRRLPGVHHRDNNSSPSTLLLRGGFFFPNLPSLGSRTPHHHAQPAARAFQVNEIACWRRVRPRPHKVHHIAACRHRNPIALAWSIGNISEGRRRRDAGPFRGWLSMCNCNGGPQRMAASMVLGKNGLGSEVHGCHFFQRQIVVLPTLTEVIIVFMLIEMCQFLIIRAGRLGLATSEYAA
mmetsp:Transcript_37115/g.89302  ORF Transcript_37115/g.89302 Transcript_37115/m.89302 type:complete len:246 (-) Transcript_37115:759-1496(-)